MSFKIKIYAYFERICDDTELIADQTPKLKSQIISYLPKDFQLVKIEPIDWTFIEDYKEKQGIVNDIIKLLRKLEK